MNTTPTTWTRHDLERFLDSDLDSPAAHDLSESLRESPALRARLAQVTRADALARAALLAPAAPPRIAWTRAVPAATLAILVLGLGLAALLMRPATPGATPPLPAAVAAASDPLVIFSIPITTPLPAPVTPDEPAPDNSPLDQSPRPAPEPGPGAPATPSITPREYIARLDSALTRGDARAAADLLDTTDPTLRVIGYQRLGATLRSVTTARLVLNELPADSRLAACRELVAEPRWRTLSATSLADLRADPATRDAVDALLAELARSPELAPFVERVRSRRQPAGHAPVDRSI